jgi:superoxide dismutase, Fe-Mn family
MNKNYPFSIDALPFATDFLEPVIDKATMEIHHDKHHQAYADNLNKAVDQNSQLASLSLEDLLKSDLPVVKNNAGGVWNHDFFWSVLTSANTSKMSESLKLKIEESFGTVEEFMSKFEQAGLTRFGSGWAWLVKTAEGKLEIVSTANQDNPLVEGKKPVLGLDVWEHAYYLKYQNRRAEYVKAFWQIVNWSKVEEFLG